MPTYDYLCEDCGHKFELFQSINDSLKRKCPECGKPKLRRLFGTGAAIVFKGSGFYETDYRSESYKKGAAAEKKDKESKEPKSSDGKNTSKTTDSSKSTPSESKPSKKD